MIAITVLGVPATQGNKTGRPFRRGDGTLGVAMVEGKTKKAAEHLHSWRGLIANQASFMLVNSGGSIIDGAVIVEATFYLPRSKAASKRLFHETRPDLDKLQRAVGDALKGVAYTEDSRIVKWVPVKRFEDEWQHKAPGAYITVRAAGLGDL